MAAGNARKTKIQEIPDGTRNMTMTKSTSENWRETMNDLAFTEKHIEVFKELARLEKEAKSIEARRKEIKAELTEAMLKTNTNMVDNDYVKITLVPETVVFSVDMKAFEWEEPELFEEVAKKYNKEIVRKPYVRITPR